MRTTRGVGSRARPRRSPGRDPRRDIPVRVEFEKGWSITADPRASGQRTARTFGGRCLLLHVHASGEGDLIVAVVVFDLGRRHGCRRLALCPSAPQGRAWKQGENLTHLVSTLASIIFFMTRYAYVKFRLRSGERTFLFRRLALDTPRSPPSLRSLPWRFGPGRLRRGSPRPLVREPRAPRHRCHPRPVFRVPRAHVLPHERLPVLVRSPHVPERRRRVGEAGAAASAARASTVASHAAASFSNASIVAATAAFGGPSRARLVPSTARLIDLRLTSLARFSSARVTTLARRSRGNHSARNAARSDSGMAPTASGHRWKSSCMHRAAATERFRESAKPRRGGRRGGRRLGGSPGCIPRSRCRRRWRGVRGRR